MPTTATATFTASTDAPAAQVVRVAWGTPPAGGSPISGYTLQRRTGTGAWGALTSVSASVLEFTDRTVTAGVQYGYRVAASNAVGTGPWSSEATVTTGTATPWLPFEAPPTAVLVGSPRKVWAHYFATDIGPISLNDATRPDYYERYLLPPGQVEGYPGAPDFRLVGGLVRDRPIYRAPLGAGYHAADQRTDVAQMAAAGLDGCVIDVLSLTSSSDPANRPSPWDRAVGIYDAVDALGLFSTFRCLPMFDLSGGAVQAATTAQMVAAIQSLAVRPAAFFIAGRFQVTWFSPEHKPAVYFSDLTAACAAASPAVLLDHTMCYVAVTSTTAPTYDTVAARHGRWGDRDPVTCNDPGSQNRGAAQYIYDTFAGKPYMAAVAPGDVRPNPGAGNNWREQQGTGQLRTAWDAATVGNGTPQGTSDWVQIPTWNDYSETANIAPSMLHGWALVDLNLYHLIRYKTGAFPAVTRDALMLSHKTQFSTGMTFTSPTFTNPMEAAGGTAASNNVEVLAFVTDPTGVTVEITTGGVTTVKTGLTAGVNVLTQPLLPGGVGSIRAVMKRGGTVVPGTQITSPWWASHTAAVHDPTYRIGSSLRGWSGTYPDRTVPASPPSIG